VRFLHPLLGIMLSVLVALPASAQDGRDDTSPEDFDGFQVLANRFYLHDPAALRDIVTSGDTAPADYPPVMAIAMVMIFDTVEHAETAFVPYSELMAGSVSGEMDEAATPDATPAIGDDTLVYRAIDEEDGYTVDATTITVREGEVIYLALVMTANDTSGERASDLMDVMLEREMSDDEVTFDEGGGSTGGPFALFPARDDEEILGGMEIRSDQYLTASGA